uniref:Actin-related protein 6 n=1 Tax=Mucochytrium quahogii TaxID=96639 RepID=A0A7S2RJN9_9STRA|mmetsp:Transcript_448/g.793  ORF Transcript_448/g.793 Transcript_448/m.793 type:complete len:379 (+) Transcript_448:25-1161(+)
MWFVIDNGGGSIKCGFVESPDCIEIPNCIAKPRKDVRTLVGVQTESDDLVNHSDLVYTRPHERGYLTNIAVETDVWDHMFEQVGYLGSVSGIIVTSPPFNPVDLAAALDQMITDHFNLYKLRKVNPAALVARYASGKSRFCLVVDSGFSFTHVTPVFDGVCYERGIRRIDVGGKLLTNYLKELVSFGEVNVMDDTYVVDCMKKRCCYVSTDIKKDLHDLGLMKRQPYLKRQERLTMAQRQELDTRFTRRYVLPDYQKVKKGYLLDPDTSYAEVEHLKDLIVTLSGECFLVPELLFNPSDLGIAQAGIPEVIEQVIAACPLETRHLLRSNVVVTGGNSLFPNFESRLSNDLGPEYIITMCGPDTAWKGGKQVAAQLSSH